MSEEMREHDGPGQGGPGQGGQSQEGYGPGMRDQEFGDREFGGRATHNTYPGPPGGTGERRYEVVMTVNGVRRAAPAPARRLLSDFLRHDLGLTGTHVGCEHGVCGCCTILLDGEPVRSCLMFAVTAAGHEITTVEGLGGADGSLSPVQRAFQECHGLQCGFCTPGFLCTVTALLRDNPAPSRAEALEGVSGNLCRCTGYQNILESVHRASELIAEAAGGADTRDGRRHPVGGAVRHAHGDATGDVAGDTVGDTR